MFKQILKFGAIGVLNTFIDVLVLNALVIIFQIYAGWPVAAFNAISFSCAVVNSYFLNKYWTFSDKSGHSRKKISQFLVISAIGALLNSGIVYMGTTFIHPVANLRGIVWVDFVKAAAILVGLVWNFFGYKMWVFNGNEKFKMQKSK